MTKLTILSGAALLAVAGVALAQGGPGDRRDRDADVTRQQVVDRVGERFARLDSNHDGRFTPDEARAMGERRRGEMMAHVFDRLDANHDGNISREEFAQGHAAMHRGMGGGMHGEMGRGMHGEMGGDHRGHRGMAMGPPPGGPEMGPPGGPGMRGARLFGEQGFVTLDQMREHALARFDRADADHDGILTAAERRQAREQMRRGRDERRPG